MLKHIEIAEIAHEQNRIYCESIGDESQPTWAEMTGWQKESTLRGVDAIAAGKVTSPKDSHSNWLDEKKENGWNWGPVKNPTLKTHPCIVLFEELPAEEKFKDYLFYHTVRGLLKLSREFANA